MRLLDRYLLRELLIPLGYCLSGFLMFWIAFDLFADLDTFQEHKMLFRDIVEYYVVKAPEFLVLVLPIALLLALLYTLTNHSRHNEITAIRAAGNSLWRLCLPYLGIGLISSVVLFALNEVWVPDSAEAAERILARRVPPPPGTAGRNQIRNLGFVNSREGRTWEIGLYNIKTGEMIHPQVIWTQPDGSRQWLDAERAIRKRGVWTFYQAREFQESAETNSMPIPLLQTNVLAMPQFTETLDEIQSEINISKGMGLIRSKNRADVPISQILNYLHLHPKPPEAMKPWLETKLQGRLAAPWTCLVVVVIAIPFGAVSGRRNIFVGVASSILICFIFFVLQQLGLALGTGGYVAPWLAAWFPNLSFGFAGLWLTERVR